MIWTTDYPLLENEWYWYRPAGSKDNLLAMPVKWLKMYKDRGWYIGEWSHRPIPFPDTQFN